MTRQTHIAAALALSLTLATYPADSRFIWSAAAALAGVLPDIDMRIGIKHRGLTHSLIALALIVLLAAQLAPELATAAAIGYGSHLALDMLTPWGIPLLYPLNTKRLRLAKFPTGGALDFFLAAGAGLLIVRALIT